MGFKDEVSKYCSRLVHQSDKLQEYAPMPFEKNKSAKRQAFTLMEVLLVLVILVVLMGFAVPALLGSKKKADIDAAKTQIGLFGSELQRYALDMGGFPTTE